MSEEKRSRSAVPAGAGPTHLGSSRRRPLRGLGYKPRASQPQVHEDDEAQDSGLDDGIVEEAAPETILPMDDEYES